MNNTISQKAKDFLDKSDNRWRLLSLVATKIEEDKWETLETLLHDKRFEVKIIPIKNVMGVRLAEREK